MSSVSTDHQADTVESKRSVKALDSAKAFFEIVFDRAPVMMHSIDRDGRLVKVNRLWLQKLGYTWEEVLGRRSTDFLTEESRARAVNDTLPLFWHLGSVRSVGYQFVRKDGRVIDVLLDADISRDERGQLVTLAALRDNHDLLQWRQASAILTAIRELGRIRSEDDAVSFSEASAGRDIEVPMVWQPPAAYLVKPVQDRELRSMIETAIYKHRLESEVRNTNITLSQRVRELAALNQSFQSFVTQQLEVLETYQDVFSGLRELTQEDKEKVRRTLALVLPEIPATPFSTAADGSGQ